MALQTYDFWLICFFTIHIGIESTVFIYLFALRYQVYFWQVRTFILTRHQLELKHCLQLYISNDWINFPQCSIWHYIYKTSISYAAYMLPDTRCISYIHLQFYVMNPGEFYIVSDEVFLEGIPTPLWPKITKTYRSDYKQYECILLNQN